MRLTTSYKYAGLIAALSVFSTTALAQQSNALDCVIEPNVVAEISSPVDGIAEAVLVEKSDIVKRGQDLASLNAAVETAIVELARAHANMTEEVRSRQTNWDFSTRKERRLSELHKSKAISSIDKEEAEMETELARLEFRKAQAKKRIAGLELARAEAVLSQRTIKSSIDGVVVERYIAPGESVKDRPLFKIAQIDPLRVEVIAPAKLFNSIQAGDQAKITPDGNPGAAVDATVTIVDKVLDAASNTFYIRLALPNKDQKITAGTRCKALFSSK